MVGRAQERRADARCAVGPDEPQLKLAAVLWAQHVGLGSGNGVMNFWKQKLEQQNRLICARRSIVESRPTTLPLSPSKFKFVPDLVTIASPTKQHVPFASPEIVKVRRASFVTSTCFSCVSGSPAPV